MKKNVRIINIIMVLVMMLFLTSCLDDEVDGPIDSIRTEKLAVIRNQCSKFDDVTKITSSITIYSGDVKVEYSNLTYDINDDVKFHSEKYTLNNDPYGELYVKTEFDQSLSKDDTFGKLSIVEFLKEENFINRIYSITLDASGGSVHGYLNPEVVKEVMGVESTNGIDKVVIDLTCKGEKLDTYQLSYNHSGLKVVITYEYTY